MGLLSNLLTANSFGSLWRPDSGGIRVGRDVGALTATGFARGAPDTMIVGKGDDVELKAGDLFSSVREAARNGKSVRQFRSISDQDLNEGKVSDDAALYRNGDWRVDFADGMLTISERNRETGAFEAFASIQVKEDTRVVWGADGEPQILTGRAAMTGGVLKAKGEDELLFRLSNCHVEAGQGTVVYNLSRAAGTYSGGDGVTYLGEYNGGTFTDTTGRVTFGGYFKDASFSGLTGSSTFSGVFEEVNADLKNGRATFSGYFSASAIIGSAERDNTMSGMFLNSCTIQGGDGDDMFSGRFINSSIDGGEGNNSFGDPGMNLMRSLVAEADFVNAEVTAGAGRDSLHGVVWGGVFNLGEGDDRADGIFSQTTILGGGGKDTLKPDYANGVSFDTGDGEGDVVDIATGVDNTVSTGEGDNTIIMGRSGVSDQAGTWQTAVEHALRTRPTQTGESARNTVVAISGESAIVINDGETSRQVVTSDGRKSSGPEAAAHNADDAAITENGPDARADDRTLRAAINRYRLVMDAASESSAGPAVTVVYGDGSREGFEGMARRQARHEDPAGGMIRSIRRYGRDGSVSWDRWMRLAG